MTSASPWAQFVYYISLSKYATFRQKQSLIYLHETKLNRIPYLDGTFQD